MQNALKIACQLRRDTGAGTEHSKIVFHRLIRWRDIVWEKIQELFIENIENNIFSFSRSVQSSLS